MARQKHTEGFTVAELLTVVAILAILMAIAGVSLVNYMRNLTFTEYNNAAKSIYIAAQNNIADLQASGEWDASAKGRFTGKEAVGSEMAAEPTAQRTDDNGETQNDGLHYYYVSAEFARNSGILPQGTIDADVWDKSFIIEYCYETAMVYGVFYTEKPQSDLDTYYAKSTSSTDIRSETARREPPVVGYYGGASARSLAHVELKAPSIVVANGHILVMDPNLDTLNAWDTYQMLTITGQDETLMLRLSSPAPNLAQVTVYRKGGSSLAKVNLAATATDDFCEKTTIPSEGSSSAKKNTYSIDIAALQAAIESVAGQEPLKFATDETVDLKSKCSSNKVLCRSAYGYAQGKWAAASEDLIFTSNIMADWQTEATIDAYVIDSTDYNFSDQQNNGRGRDIEIALNNFYDDDTWSENKLCYSVLSRGGMFSPDIEVRDKSGGQGKPVPEQDGYFMFERTKDTQYLTLTVNPLDIAKIDNLSYTVLITAHKVDSNGAVPSPTKTLVVTINVHKSDGYPYYYVADVPGSLYAELTLLMGLSGDATITWPSGISIDASSPLVKGVVKESPLRVENLPAQSSYSVKFLKSNPHDDYSKEKKPFGYDGSGIVAY